MRDKDLFFGVILENIVNLGQKVRNWRLVRSDDLFFRDYCISETKSALPGMILGNEFFFLEITLNLGRKPVLNIQNFMTWFWHANCMISLRGHRTPSVLGLEMLDHILNQYQMCF